MTFELHEAPEVAGREFVEVAVNERPFQSAPRDIAVLAALKFGNAFLQLFDAQKKVRHVLSEVLKRALSSRVQNVLRNVWVEARTVGGGSHPFIEALAELRGLGLVVVAHPRTLSTAVAHAHPQFEVSA